MRWTRAVVVMSFSVVFLTGAICSAGRPGGPWARGQDEKPWEKRKRENQDRMGGVPPAILEKQSRSPVEMAPVEEAIEKGLAVAKQIFEIYLKGELHQPKPPPPGKVLAVPDDQMTIQAAIDSAEAGDTVLVRAGTYYELLVMKDGVKLVSDPADGGEEMVPVEGARLQLPRRTLRTIIDGSKAKASRHGMIDFDPGLGRYTVVDGFTIQNLPEQNHHLPGHAHGLNVRGASPVIMNCLIRDNGSTGIGNHVVYHDQGKPLAERDFRRANIKHESSALIYRNIIHGNLGLGIGCNHFSSPYVLGNEVFHNDDSDLGEKPSPGLGNKHGATPTFAGNVVHDNPGGGILGRKGEPQGKHPIDGRTKPAVLSNVVYDNGSFRPGIACNDGGSREQPIRIVGNHVYRSGATGIALSEGAVGIIVDNCVEGSLRAGIAIDGSTALELNDNKVTGAREAPGFVILDGAVVVEMKGNASDSNQGPRFVLRGGTIEGESGSGAKGPPREKPGRPEKKEPH